MIVIRGHGRTRTDDAATYRQYVIDTGIEGYRSTRGNMGAQIWQRREGEITHIWTISFWKDYDSIRAFAGEPIETAKYYEEDARFLLEVEAGVMHCEAYDFPGLQSADE